MAEEFNLDKYATVIHETAVAKGFWGESCTGEEYPSDDKLMAKLALVHSEVTEVLEAYRKTKGPDAIVEEFSDAIIRLLDVYAAMYVHGIVDVSLQDAFEIKMMKNKLRPALHGHKWG